MAFAYPVTLNPEPDRRLVNVSFPDVPGALTFAETEAEALQLAGDCLIAALRGYMKLGQPIPPAGPSHGHRTVALPSLIAAKVALYSAMRDRGVSIIELARRLGIAESTMKRILDLDRRSHIGDIEAALATMGLRLEVIAREAA
jgi:antitoxin HicB